MEDEDIPLQFRKPIVARRRIRDLPKTKVLAFELKTIQSWVDINNLTIHDFESLIENHRYYYVNSIRERKSGDVLVWTFVVVSKGSLVLTYRQGQYREGRDSFLHKRCVGFYNLVTDNDITLFERDDHGVLSSGIRTIAMDLDLPVDVIINSDSMQYSSFMCTFAEKGADLLAVMKYECPNWYEPLNRRLSLNDLTWLDATHVPNNMDDFDPWSQAVLQRVRSNLTTNTDND